jgi:hypothetical protein
MVQHIERCLVELVAVEDLELEGGGILPAARYKGAVKVRSIGSRKVRTYFAELPRDALLSMGLKVDKTLVAAEIEVTELVNSGQIHVSSDSTKSLAGM